MALGADECDAAREFSCAERARRAATGVAGSNDNDVLESQAAASPNNASFEIANSSVKVQ